MPFPSMPTQVSCPKCNKKFVVQLRTIIDVGEDPEAKEEFLRSRVNYAECPQCRSGGTLSVPLVYHDPGKELLISYVPAELGMSADEQEQFIGSLVNSLMNSLPADKRKGYFLRPKSALTMDSLYDTILEADGVSKEELEAQRARLRLVSNLLSAIDDEKRLDELVTEHRQELDYTFFLLLSDIIDSQGEDGEEETSPLRTLRDKLLKRVNPSMPAVAQADASYDNLIGMLQGKEADGAWRTTIVLNRTRLDYGFFQHLTGKIDAAIGAGDTDSAEALVALRKRILEELDAQDRMVREAEDQASLLIMQLSEAEDLNAAVREHRDEIDQVFLGVVARLQAMAKARGNQARAGKLNRILETSLAALEEDWPADLRLINRLLRADHPEGTNALLEENRGLLSDEFLKTFDRYVTDLEQDESELAGKLKKVREQIVAKRTVLRG